MSLVDNTREAVSDYISDVRGKTSAKLFRFSSEARGAVEQAYGGALTTQTAQNISRFGLSGTGLGTALSGLTAGAVGGESMRLAYEREISRLQKKLGWGRNRILKHLGISDPGGFTSRIGPSIGRLEGASRMFSPVAASSGTGFGTAPGSGPLPSVASPQSPRMFSAPEPPGLMGPNPLRLS